MERLGHMDVVGLSPLEEERYARQLLLPELGVEGQLRLKAASSLVVGAGGLGSPLLYYLVGSGIGRVGIVDDDRLSLSNLPRQILYTTEQVGRGKAQLAAQHLKRCNPHSQIEVYEKRFARDNAEQIAQGYDLVIDACDNLTTRCLMDEVTEHLGIPYLYGAVEGFRGQCSLFAPGQDVRYRDLFALRIKAETDMPLGIIAPVAGFIASLMATEAIKKLSGLDCAIEGKLLMVNTHPLIELTTLDL
ncbi:HesA/MoeB/ThiF family protein [Porphyromonas sp. COT-239 OH1446]|uniref:HesA/MoeB/ThiF family protein n=1 Tax=Porphyromonas sp. COT-239 OH1446 TaxID=1515613 RepID=UPI0009DE71EB|nr:HesA/MoeB/ThiF family protein [Porphyromonas sp. COT-239 OH1446]